MKLSSLITKKGVSSTPLTDAWMKWYKHEIDNFDDSSHNDGRFHPSQLIGCPAMLFLAMEGFPIPNDINDRVFRIFGNGDGVHERIQVQLCKAGVLDVSMFDESMETPIYIPALNIGGHTDGVLNFGPKKQDGTFIMFGKECPRFKFANRDNRAILEIKSINARGFAEVKKKGEPKPEHKYQANIYCRALGIDRTIILYEDKNCVPDYTRILTKRGWLYHYQLRKTDYILTYNPEKHSMEWEQYSGKKKVYKMKDETVYRIGNKHRSFVSTAEHRWPTFDYRNKFNVKTTLELNSNCWVPLVAPYEYDGDGTFTDADARILGLWVTDGWTAKDKYFNVCQVKKQNIKLFNKIMGSKSAAYNKVQEDGTPYVVHYWKVPDSLRDKLRSLNVYDRESFFPLLVKMSSKQLQLFYDSMLLGDGSWSSTGNKVQFSAMSKIKKEIFQLTSTLLGMPCNIVKGSCTVPQRYKRFRVSKAKPEKFTGEVWCPQTKNGFWLMEQNGLITITGNTQEWQEFTVKYDPKLFAHAENKVLLVERWRKEYKKTGMIPRGVFEVAKESAKDRKPWLTYAIDLIKPPIGKKSIVDMHAVRVKATSKLLRRKKHAKK